MKKWKKAIIFICRIVILVCLTLLCVANFHIWNMSRPQMVALIAVMFSGAIGITWLTDRTSKAYKIYKYIITVLLVAVFFLAVIFGKTP